MLNEVIKRNGIKDANLIRPGQELDLPDPEYYDGSIQPARATAERRDYSRTPINELPNTREVDMEGNWIPGYADRVYAYAQAINDGSLTLDQVPEQYRQQAYNQSIRNTTNTAAPYVVKWVLGAPWTFADTAIRSGLSEGRKLIARAQGKDTSNDYGWGDYFGDFSWTGKQFEAEHPELAFAADVLATPVIMTGTENMATHAMDGVGYSAGRNLFQNGAAAARAYGVEPVKVVDPRGKAMAGAERQAAQAAHAPKRGGVSYGGPGSHGGNTGTGRTNKSVYYPKQGRAVVNETAQTAETGRHFAGTGYWHGLYMPMTEPARTNYVVVEPEETHIEEKQPTQSKWVITTDYNGPRIPYRPEYEEAEYVEAQAPRGNSVREQPITKESMQKKQGLVKRSAEEVSGPAEGSTPSGWYSGYGFTYGNNGGVWLRRNGGKLIKKFGNH